MDEYSMEHKDCFLFFDICDKIKSSMDFNGKGCPESNF